MSQYVTVRFKKQVANVVSSTEKRKAYALFSLKETCSLYSSVKIWRDLDLSPHNHWIAIISTLLILLC